MRTTKPGIICVIHIGAVQHLKPYFFFYFPLFFFLFASLSYCKMAHNSTIRVSLKLQVSHSFDSQNDLPHIYCDFCFASIFLKAFFWSSKEKRTKQHKTATRTDERYLKLAIQESCSHWITKCSILQELQFPNMEKEVKPDKCNESR